MQHTGPYEWVHAIHPDGLNSFDMGVWQEDDGTAFLVRSVNNEYVGISPLSPDYTTTTGLVSTAPRVCHKFDAFLHLISSLHMDLPQWQMLISHILLDDMSARL